MVVSELALLRLLPSSQLSSPTLLSKLSRVKAVLESSYNRPFYFLRQIEDPSLIYIIGSWPSIREHMEEFIPSPANQECLELLKNDIKVEFMFHIELDPGYIPTHMPVIGIERHAFKRPEGDNLAATSGKTGYSKKRSDSGTDSWVGGWRIDYNSTTHGSGKYKEAEGQQEEIVLFTGWESREQHFERGKLDSGRTHGNTEVFADAVESMHAVHIDLLLRRSDVQKA